MSWWKDNAPNKVAQTPWYNMRRHLGIKTCGDLGVYRESPTQILGVGLVLPYALPPSARPRAHILKLAQPTAVVRTLHRLPDAEACQDVDTGKRMRALHMVTSSAPEGMVVHQLCYRFPTKGICYILSTQKINDYLVLTHTIKNIRIYSRTFASTLHWKTTTRGSENIRKHAYWSNAMLRRLYGHLWATRNGTSWQWKVM